MNIFENVSLFEHGQYFIDAGAGLDQRPSIPVEDEVAVLIFTKAKKDGFVVKIENGDHALTIVHHGRNTGSGEAVRTQLVAKCSQDGNVGHGKRKSISGGCMSVNSQTCHSAPSEVQRWLRTPERLW